MKRALSFILVALVLSTFAIPGITAEDYPTNTEISYEFMETSLFDEYWEDGTYRCGTDFPAGDYYAMSIHGAAVSCKAEDSPDDFSYSYDRVMRKFHLEVGQYVLLFNGGILVPAEQVDTDNWQEYGVFLVGVDLPSGIYKVTSITDEYQNASGVIGAYQVCNNSPEATPVRCVQLFDRQSYVTLKDGQYIVMNDAHLELVASESIDNNTLTASSTESTPSPTPASTPSPTPVPTQEPTPTPTPKVARVNNGAFTFTPREFKELVSKKVLYGMKLAEATSDSYVLGILDNKDNTVYSKILFAKDDNTISSTEANTEGINSIIVTLEEEAQNIMRIMMYTVDPSLSVDEVTSLADDLFNGLLGDAAKTAASKGSVNVASERKEINGIQYNLVYNSSSSMPSFMMSIIALPEQETIYTDSTTIAQVQETLNNIGYECGVADGVIGTKTIEAIKQYQKDNGLDVNGEITDELLDSMGIGDNTGDVQPTMGEKNALRSAKSYLDAMPFSYNGLIEQLEYEGYSHSEAVYGADNCGADWNEQAAKSAKSYLETMSFSRNGLIEQLEYEGFTYEQAVYGVEQNGY